MTSFTDLQAALTGAEPEQFSHVVERDRGRFSLRWILVHLIDEYARHCGHADLTRQSADDATGD